MANLPAAISVPVERSDLNEIKLKLEKKCKKICIRSENIRKNVNNKDLSSKSCDINEISWILDEDNNLIDHLKKSVSEMKIDYPSTNTEKYAELYETLQKQNAQQCAVFEHSRKELKEEQIMHEQLFQSLNIIQSNKNKIKSSETQNLEVLDMIPLKEKSAKKFNEMKQYMHFVLEKLYSNGSMKLLVQRLTNAYFKVGDDKYIEIKNVDEYPDLELLKEAFLIVHDPYNANRIKIANFK